MNRRTLRRFLLDELPAAERERLEEHLLADGEAADLAAAEEDDLVDAYVAGTLGDRERRAFAAAVDRSERLRGRVVFARTLAEVARTEGAAPAAERERVGWRRWLQAPALQPGLGWSFAAAAAVLAVVAIGLYDRSRDAGHRLAAAEAGRQELAAERDGLARKTAELEAALAREREAGAEATRRLEDERRRLAAVEAERDRLAASSRRPPATVSFLLAAALRSGAGIPELAVPADAGAVRLDLDLGGEEPYASYLAVLTGPSGAQAWSEARLPPAPGGTRVELRLPAAVLRPGHYELRLSGTPAGGGPAELVAAYEFRVHRPDP